MASTLLRRHAVYLLRGRLSRTWTYIGYTLDPRRRLRQHTGEIKGGAKRTKNRNALMVLCLYGFPTNVAALQFEWAWQNPAKSKIVRRVAKGKRWVGPKKKVELLCAMLALEPWRSLPLHMQFMDEALMRDTEPLRAGLPAQIDVTCAPVEDLPHYAATPADEREGGEDSAPTYCILCRNSDSARLATYCYKCMTQFHLACLASATRQPASLAPPLVIHCPSCRSDLSWPAIVEAVPPPEDEFDLIQFAGKAAASALPMEGREEEEAEEDEEEEESEESDDSYVPLRQRIAHSGRLEDDAQTEVVILAD